MRTFVEQRIESRLEAVHKESPQMGKTQDGETQTTVRKEKTLDTRFLL